MNFSLRCILGHKWEACGHGDLHRRLDNKVVGSFLIMRCTTCGKITRKDFK